MRLDVDKLTAADGDQWAARDHANALYCANEPMHPDDVETLFALLAEPEVWQRVRPVRGVAATAVLNHALRTDDPALVTRLRKIGPYGFAPLGTIPVSTRCLRAALEGIGTDDLQHRDHALRFWSVKVNVCDFSVVADVLVGELGSRDEKRRNGAAPGWLAASILLRSAMVGRDPDVLRAALTGATDLPDRPTRARAALIVLAGVETLCERFDAVRALAAGRPARRSAAVNGILGAVNVRQVEDRIHRPAGYPYATAVALADELADTIMTRKAVAALRATLR